MRVQNGKRKLIRGSENINTEVMWNNMKKCLSVIVSDLVAKLDRRARKPWITKKLSIIWMKEGNGIISGTMKEEKKTQKTQERI
jgi:hypothetical protein